MKISNQTLKKPFWLLCIIALTLACTEELQEDPVSNPQLTSLKDADNSDEIKVMSFNVKHDNDNDLLGLLKRRESILSVISKHNPEILGLQEFSNNWFESWLTSELSVLGYKVYMNELQSFGSPKAIFYKADRFICEKVATFQIVLTEKRSGAWVVLNDLKTGNRFFVCNNHWTTVSSAERLKSAKDVASIVEQNSNGLPVILLGDLNAKPGTAEINYLKSTGLVSTHSDKGNTYNGWESTGIRKIDWIFCSRDLAFTNYGVINDKFDGFWPSDHMPLYTTVIPAIFGDVHFDKSGRSSSSKTTYYFADVTGDGKADKIYWNPTFDSGHTRVYRSNGNGTFTFLNSNTNGYSKNSATKYYFADVTGDGKADKIYWNPTFDSGRTRVYRSNGDGTFTFLNSNTNGYSTNSATTYYFADVTGDGKADKIYWNPTFDSGHTRVYRSNGDGTFTFLNSNTNGYSTNSATTYYFADVTGDGKADKIYWNPTFDSGHTRVYRSNGNGTFTFLNSNTNGYSTNSATTYYFADVTGDGKADKIYWNPASYKGKIKVYRSNGNGTFDDPIYSLRGISQSTNTNYYFTDISGDGKADQVFWDYTASPEGNAPGTLMNFFAN